MEKFIVEKQTGLMDALAERFPGWSRTRIKQCLAFRAVSVNGRVETKFNYPLQTGDQLAVFSRKETGRRQLLTQSSIQPVYEDEDLVVVNKPCGLLTMANAATRTDTLYHNVSEYVKTTARSKEARVFIVHRLDEDASGLVVFAKNEQAKHDLQEHWERTEKKYYAVVEGCSRENSGEIRNYLAENDAHRVYVTPNQAQGRLAVTRYKVLKTARGCSLLDIILVTGRKNQIRVHLAGMGCPIIGDKKYGAATNPARRLGLHAYYLALTHPVTGKRLSFRAELPARLKFSGFP